jgi:branched-subunit amino acid aminotransferase/4-amino-4-deoxychorismate lyase
MAETARNASLQWRSTRGWEPVRDLTPTGGHRDVLNLNGMRAYRWQCGTPSLFRPLDYFRVLRRRCREQRIPPPPEHLLVQVTENLVGEARESIPHGPLDSLHLPMTISAVEPGGSGNGYEFRIDAEVDHSGSRLRPITLQLDERALALSPDQHPFFVVGRAESPLVLSPRAGTAAVVERHTVREISRKLGFAVREVDLAMEGWRFLAERTILTEAFACGPDPLVTPVGAVESPLGKVLIGQAQPGYVAINVRRAMARLTQGQLRDESRWNRTLRGSAVN